KIEASNFQSQTSRKRISITAPPIITMGGVLVPGRVLCGRSAARQAPVMVAEQRPEHAEREEQRPTNERLASEQRCEQEGETNSERRAEDRAPNGAGAPEQQPCQRHPRAHAERIADHQADKLRHNVAEAAAAVGRDDDATHERTKIANT